MLQVNSKDNFYKYYPIDAVQKIIKEGTLLWSHPKKFNDPFDNQFDLSLDSDLEQVARDIITVLKKGVPSSSRVIDKDFATYLRVMLSNDNLYDVDELVSTTILSAI